MDWNDIKIFLALIRHGNVRAAAAVLKVSHSTVARRIDALEKKLGVRLFDRLSTGYVLTPVGDDMKNVAESVEEELGGFERRVLGHDRKLSGRIRATMVDALATNLLMPYLAQFTREYPEIELEVDISYEAADLDRREADIAFRFTRNPPEHLVGRRLLICSTAAYASESYLESRDLRDPASACWIGFGNHDPVPSWVKESSFPSIPVKGRFVSLLAQVEACKEGMGIGMLPCFLGESEPRLKRLSPAKSNPSFELWILMHGDVRTSTRIRVFSQFMASAILAHRPSLDGIPA